LDIPAANALPLLHAISSRKHSGKHTNSEHDSAWILHELAHGKEAANLTRTIPSRPSDNPVASARLCLIEGVPMEGVCHAAGGPPPLRDCLCAAYPKGTRQGCGGAVCEEAYSWGGVRGFCAGVEGRSCIRFRGGAGTVLRTGRISTLHPWEGTVGKPGLALGEPSLHPIDSVRGGSIRKPVYTCVNAGVGNAESDGAAQ
jgi:hypothetical protein